MVRKGEGQKGEGRVTEEGEKDMDGQKRRRSWQEVIDWIKLKGQGPEGCNEVKKDGVAEIMETESTWSGRRVSVYSFIGRYYQGVRILRVSRDMRVVKEGEQRTREREH